MRWWPLVPVGVGCFLLFVATEPRALHTVVRAPAPPPHRAPWALRRFHHAYRQTERAFERAAATDIARAYKAAVKRVGPARAAGRYRPSLEAIRGHIGWEAQGQMRFAWREVFELNRDEPTAEALRACARRLERDAGRLPPIRMPLDSGSDLVGRLPVTGPDWDRYVQLRAEFPLVVQDLATELGKWADEQDRIEAAAANPVLESRE